MHKSLAIGLGALLLTSTAAFAQEEPVLNLFNWSGLAAPKGTPADVIARLQTEIHRALQAPDMKGFLAQMGSQPGNLDSPAFAQLIQRETAQWAAVAQKAQIEKQ